MLTPALADSSEITAAFCMRIDALHMFRIKPIVTGDLAPSDYWRPGPASGNYGSDKLGLAIAKSESLKIMSARLAPAVLALSRRAHHPSAHVTVR